MTETTNQAPTEDIREALKDVIDPELGVNVVDLGLLYGLHYADDGALLVDMTLTTAACPLTDEIEDQVSRAIGTMVDEWRLNWVTGRRRGGGVRTGRQAPRRSRLRCPGRRPGTCRTGGCRAPAGSSGSRA